MPRCAALDADGNPTDGSSNNVLHFDAGQHPPVDAFRSVTMYDQEGLQVANTIDRYAIGDRDDLQPAEDGALDTLVQHDSPGPEAEANSVTGTEGAVQPLPAVVRGDF